MVTTGVGFRGWMDAAHEHGLDEGITAALRGAQFVARGPKAHGAIQQAGFTADWVAESETSAEVGEYLLASGITGKRIVVQHHGAGADGLDELLAGAGADVVSVTVYRWGPPPDPEVVRRSALQAGAGEADAVLFTSAPGAASWLAVAEEAGALDDIRRRAASGRLLLAAVGPITAGPLLAADLETTIADRGRLGSLARCVIAHFGGGRAPSLETDAGRLEVRSGGVLIDERFVPLSHTAARLMEALFVAEREGAVARRDRTSAAGQRPQRPRGRGRRGAVARIPVRRGARADRGQARLSAGRHRVLTRARVVTDYSAGVSEGIGTGVSAGVSVGAVVGSTVGEGVGSGAVTCACTTWLPMAATTMRAPTIAAMALSRVRRRI